MKNRGQLTISCSPILNCFTTASALRDLVFQGTLSSLLDPLRLTDPLRSSEEDGSDEHIYYQEHNYYKGKERRTIYVERRSNTSLPTPYMDVHCTGNTHCGAVVVIIYQLGTAAPLYAPAGMLDCVMRVII